MVIAVGGGDGYGVYLVEGPRHRHQVDNLFALDLDDEAAFIWFGPELCLHIDSDSCIRLCF